jgi:hypothetical protein
VVIELVHNFFVNVTEELSASIETCEVNTELIFVNFIEIDRKFDFSVSGLVGDFALPLAIGNFVSVDIFLALEGGDESHEDVVGSTSGEELGVLAHVILELSNLTRLLLVNVGFSNVKVAKELLKFLVVTITTSNFTGILLSTTSITAFSLLSFNSRIDSSLSVLEFFLNLLLTCGFSLHPWVIYYAIHVGSMSWVNLHN